MICSRLVPIRIRLPVANAADIEMYKVRFRIKSHTTRFLRDSGPVQRTERFSGKTDINRFPDKMHASPRDISASSRQVCVGCWRAIAGDNVVWLLCANGLPYGMEQVQQADVDRPRLIGPEVSENVIDFGQCVRNVASIRPVRYLKPFIGMQIIEGKCACAWCSSSRQCAHECQSGHRQQTGTKLQDAAPLAY